MTTTIYLVNAGNDEAMASIANDYSFPPLNILALGTWLEQQLPDLKIICRDAGAMGTKSIVDEITKTKPWMVGVGVLATSYQSALKIAQAGKDIGAYTVFGNDHAAHMAQAVIECRPQVDFVIGAEYGEISLGILIENLLSGNDTFAAVPALAWRRSDGKAMGFDYALGKAQLSILKIQHNRKLTRQNGLDIFPTVNRNLYPKSHWDTYLSNYLETFGHLHPEAQPKGVTTMNRARGCNRANENIKCKHCDMLLDISMSSPERFWQEVISANEQVGSEVFYEVCDSLTSFGAFIDRITLAKPAKLGFDPQFFVYGQALDIVRKPTLPKTLRDLGVYKINIGLESGCNRTLKHMKGPKDSVAANLEALKMMKKEGIHIYGSFVLGTEAETPETLRETVDWIKMIIDEDLISDVEAQPILPLFNNYYGKVLFENYSPPGEPDWPADIDNVSREYITRHSQVSFDDCINAATEIRHHAAKRNKNFGSGVSKAANYEIAP